MEPLHYNVPNHLIHDLWAWLRSGFYRYGETDPGVMRSLLSAMRDEGPSLSGYKPEYHYDGFERYFRQKCEDPEFFLSAVRALLRQLPYGDRRISRLERILKTAHSGYTVRDDGKGLNYRVQPEVRAQVEAAVADSPEPLSRLLTRAWNAAYGLDPRPEDAVGAAFNAAEAALRPIISPKGKVSLFRLIEDYEVASDKWESCLEESRPEHTRKDKPELDGREVVIQMARGIAYGQKGRHVDSDSVEVNSPEEARAIVGMAVSIVALVNQGVLRRMPNM